MSINKLPFMSAPPDMCDEWVLVKYKNIQEYEEKIENLTIAAVHAFSILNEIRAKDGVPHDFYGFSYSITEKYFSDIVDSLTKTVEEITGKSAHCHEYMREKLP